MDYVIRFNLDLVVYLKPDKRSQALNNLDTLLDENSSFDDPVYNKLE